jgi:hypothetical protein
MVGSCVEQSCSPSGWVLEGEKEREREREREIEDPRSPSRHSPPVT